MRPLLHAALVNGRFGDPAVYVETLFERRAILFDLGDLHALPPRKLHRLEHVLVSHMHIDHFVGFDQLLRVLVGREKTLALYGPAGFIDHVRHKLRAYQWNLVDRYLCELTFIVTEIDASLATRTVRFRLKTAFADEEIGQSRAPEGVLHRDAMYRIRTAMFEHRTACLGYAVEEAAHINVWKNRLAQLGLPVGPWLRELKRAVLENWPDQTPIEIRARAGGACLGVRPLGTLREVLSITPGQKIGYVTDVADTPANRAAIRALVADADLLFIEAAFAAADAALAAERAHLTTAAAGEIARQAGVRRIEPFHFSPRYEGQEEQMLAEVMAAFSGEKPTFQKGAPGP